MKLGKKNCFTTAFVSLLNSTYFLSTLYGSGSQAENLTSEELQSQLLKLYDPKQIT